MPRHVAFACRSRKVGIDSHADMSIARIVLRSCIETPGVLPAERVWVMSGR